MEAQGAALHAEEGLGAKSMRMTRLRRPERAFVPAKGFGRAFLQTWMGAFLPLSANPLAPARLDVETVPLTLADGDIVVAALRECGTESVVYLLPGFAGAVTAPALRAVASRLAAGGHVLIALNGRGSGLGRGLARAPFHAGTTGDLLQLFAYGRRRYPGRRHVAVGFSLSGNTLLCALAESERRCLDGAIAIHPPVDLAHTVERLERGWGRLYGAYYAWVLRRAHASRRRARMLAGPRRLPLLGGLRAIDSAWTAGAAGYATVEEYYAGCSSRQRLQRIRVPTVVLAALDDPIVDAADITAAERAACVAVHLERRGGHMGYLARGRSPWPTRWLPEVVAHYVTALSGMGMPAQPTLASRGGT